MTVMVNEPMTAKESINMVLDLKREPYKMGEWDCARMCNTHINNVTGEMHLLPEAPLTARKVMSVLGRPKRTGTKYGDIVLMHGLGEDDGLTLGIYAGWAVLTMADDVGLDPPMGFMPLRQKHLAWSVGNG